MTVLKYLCFTRDCGLHSTRCPAILEGYSDANWISNVEDPKSHSCYVFTLGGVAVSWKSSKKNGYYLIKDGIRVYSTR